MAVLTKWFHTRRNLANNELAGLPYDTFGHQAATCSLNITANPCAEQPCGAGLQWYKSKQGVEFCASDVPASGGSRLGGAWEVPTLLMCFLVGTLQWLGTGWGCVTV